MPAFIARGTMKPPFGARVNPTHPFGRGLLLALSFNECAPDGQTYDAAGTTGFTHPLFTPGSIRPQAIAGWVIGNNGRLQWTSNREGKAFSFVHASGYLELGNDWLPTTAISIAIIRRKTDTTIRGACTFGLTGGTAATYCRIYAPWSDSVVYWEFGGTSGANSLSVSGLSFPATIEKWVFTAGPRGSAIWQNGRKAASQSTAITRTAAPSNGPRLNNNGFATPGDLQEVNYLAVYNTQWSDDLCRWWSAEPYAHLYPQTAHRQGVLLGDVAPAAATVRPAFYYAQQRQQAL